MNPLRQYATVAGMLLTLVTVSWQLTRAESELLKTTVTYREVNGHRILADIYRPEGDGLRPVIVWIHGGALIMGHREAIHPQVRALAKEKGYALVSLDYRLAPETKLPDLISDIEAAFTWLAEDGAERFHLDGDRVVVCGGSAGGYLTLVTGYRAQPQPTALVALYGYGDLIGDWYSTPSPHPRHNRRKISREEADKQTDRAIISNARQRKGNGRILYSYYRQNGTWLQEVSGFDLGTIAEKIASFEPVGNVTPKYPPTLLIHGTNDTDVPYEESKMMAEQLEKNGVPFVLKTIENGEHGFRGGDPTQIEAAYPTMREFITRNLE